MTDVVRCPACEQANRIPSLAEGKQAVCGRCKAPLVGRAGKTIAVTDATFNTQVASGPVVVDFWAAWCGPCRQIAPVIEALAADRNDVVFAKLDVDQNKATAARFRVSGIPTLVFLRNGSEVGRIVGAVSRREIEQSIMQYFGS